MGRAKSQLRQAHASMNYLLTTLKKVQAWQQLPVEKVRILEEKERKSGRKVKHVRSRRQKMEARLRLVQARLFEKSGKVMKLKARQTRQLRRSHTRERQLVEKLKHRESKVKKMLRRLEMTKSKEGMLAKRVRQELGRVRYKLEKLNLEIAAFSHKSHKWRSLKRAGTSVPRSKKISTPVHSPQKHRALGLQVTLRAAHDKVGKIANQFNKVIAKSQRLEKAKARITRVYRLKLTRYLFQVHKLENKKRKLKMMLSVLVARSIKEATGRIWSVRKLVARNAYRVAGGRYETKMVSEIHILRLRKRKLDRQVKKEMGRYINEMMTLNRGIRVLRKIKTRMKRALKREMKNRKTELLRRSRKLNTQIELENGFINHARHASGFQKVGLAKEAKMEHRKRVQEATQLKRTTDVVERESQSHR